MSFIYLFVQEREREREGSSSGMGAFFSGGFVWDDESIGFSCAIRAVQGAFELVFCSESFLKM